MKKKTIIIILLIVFLNPISLIFFAISFALWSNAHPDKGENVEQVSWLPKEATNISYYKTYSWTAYEFDISEDGFKKWAKGYDLKTIDKPVEMMRYCYFTTKTPEYDSAQDGEYNKWQERVNVKIFNGYYYRTPPRPNCGGTYVAYDLDQGKAYYRDNPR